jgi:hypothetical protein
VVANAAHRELVTTPRRTASDDGPNRAADHPGPLVLAGEPMPAQPGALCSGGNARKGLSQRRR